MRETGAAVNSQSSVPPHPVQDDYVEGAGEKSARQILDKKKVGDWQAPPCPPPEEGVRFFQEFPLEREILRAALDDLGFVKCTPIQGLALPVAMEGKDLAGRAQTGTGKTAVFLMSMLHQFLNSPVKRKLNQPFALALAPTRELAIQIAKDAENLSVYTSLRTVAVFGGMDYERQRRLLQAGCDLIVATPGRLIDFLQKQVIDTSELKVLIIDEADRMLDMGFIPDVKRIISRLPSCEERQTMLFSATLSRDIMELASRWMRPEPAVLEVEPEKVVAEGVNETVYACTTQEKLAIMIYILNHEDCHRTLIFRNRKRDVEELTEILRNYGVKCEMLSGDVNQNRRLNILEDFRTGKTKVVVATDVAGRGIQVDDITHVFNYDLPYEAEDYVHRVGRTARAGHQGRAISFASEDNAFVIPDIETYIGRDLPITQPDDEMLVLPPPVAPVQHREQPNRPRDSFGGHREGGHSSFGGSFGGHRGGSPRPNRPRTGGGFRGKR
ncbi:MAG: DEAD/DEAH box helicase [Victivallales bacterium]|nr:DEAD/DEAH box helicase [Victivallales bacterium]